MNIYSFLKGIKSVFYQMDKKYQLSLKKKAYSVIKAALLNAAGHIINYYEIIIYNYFAMFLASLNSIFMLTLKE